MKFRKKPIVIEAFQMTERRMRELGRKDWPKWLIEAEKKDRKEVGFFGITTEGEFYIRTLENQTGNALIVSAGDWIIQGINGELYPCKPDIFEKTYEAVS